MKWMLSEFQGKFYPCFFLTYFGALFKQRHDGIFKKLYNKNFKYNFEEQLSF